MEKSKKILIVEDEPKIREMLVHQLAGIGYQVTEAYDGQNAILALKNDKSIFLVILDVLLPEVSGLDVYDAIRKEFPEVKIVVSSVYPKEEQKFLVWDADGYYYKMDNFDVLFEEVNNLFESACNKG